MLYIFLIFAENLNIVSMNAIAMKRQTAFRLDKELLFYLKRRAKQQNKTLNAFVEDTLRKAVEADMEGWPVIDGPIEISEELKKWQCKIEFTPEEIAADDRLAYILSKCQ